MQDPATLQEPPAVHYHRIVTPEGVCSARASACLVWTTVTETMLEASAAPVPLDLLGVSMPVATPSHPAENGHLAAETDDSAAAIPRNSTATSGAPGLASVRRLGELAQRRAGSLKIEASK